MSPTDATKKSIATIATDKKSERPSTLISTLNENSKETVKIATTKKIGKKILSLLNNIKHIRVSDVNVNAILLA